MRTRELTIACGILILILAGCSMLPQKRTQSESFKGAEAFAGTNALIVRKVIEGEKSQPLPNLTVSGASNTVTVSTSPFPFGSNAQLTRPYRDELNLDTASGQAITSTQSSQSKFSVSLPVGVSLILATLGILGCGFAIRYGLRAAREGSVAVRAALDAGDQALAIPLRKIQSRVEAIRDHAAHETDKDRIAALQAERALLATQMAELEAQRGKLRKTP